MGLPTPKINILFKIILLNHLKYIKTSVIYCMLTCAGVRKGKTDYLTTEKGISNTE